MTVPSKFRKNKSRILTSFDSVAIESGIGYTKYFVGSSTSGAYIVNSTKFDSERPHTGTLQGTTAGGTFTKYVDIDADITFNLPRTVKGDLFVNVPIGVKNRSALSTESWFMYVVTKIYHFDGSTETQLGTSASGAVFFTDALNNNESKGFTANNKVNVPSTHFKIGETLRISTHGYFATNGATPRQSDTGIGHEPNATADEDFFTSGTTSSGRVIDSNTTNTISIDVPFRTQR